MLAMIVVTAVCIAVGGRLRTLPAMISALLFWSIAAMGYVLQMDQMSWGQDVLSVAALLASVLALAFAAVRQVGKVDGIVYGAALAFWALVSRLGLLFLTSSSFGMKTNASITFSWIVAVVALLGAGFAWRAKELRWMGLAVIASTVGKVLLIDLAALDPGIRVAILLVLGTAMIAGGYVYIRSQKAVEA